MRLFIALLCTLLINTVVWGADTKTTDLTELATTPASGDLIPIVDVSDSTMSEEGTNKKIQYSNLMPTEDTIEGYIFDSDAEAILGVWEVQDDVNLNFGDDADWGVQYDATNQRLLWTTTATNGSADATPMWAIRADSGGSGMDANQQIFGVLKSGTNLFSVDEDGDAAVSGSLTLASGTIYGTGMWLSTGCVFSDQGYIWLYESEANGGAKSILQAAANITSDITYSFGDTLTTTADVDCGALTSTEISGDFTIGGTTQSFGDGDATPDVSNAALGTDNIYQTANTGATTITDFDDGDDHSEFADGYWFILRVDDGNTTIDFSSNANIEGNAGVDFTGSATQITYILFLFEDSRWNAVTLTEGMASPTALGISAINMGSGTLEIPNGTSDFALSNAGEFALNETDEQIVVHSGSNGEISGEAALSLIDHVSIVLDPGTWYDTDTEVFLFTIGDDYPEGIIIDEWKVSCNVDPDVEPDFSLMYADAWIGLANAATIDVLDTTSGVASEDTDANINGGSAVPNGKVVYGIFTADPEGTCVQMILDIWFHAEED